MFCTQSFSIRFKRNGAQKFAHSFGCLLVEKEERQNSNCGVNFSQRFKRKGALFCRSERSVPSIIVLCKIWRTNNISGPSHFHKNVPGKRLCFEKNRNTLPIVILWKMRGSKNFRICSSNFQFLWVLQMTNACLIQTRLPKCFPQRNVKTPFRRQTLVQTSK